MVGNGAGKDLVAHAIHDGCERRAARFAAVDYGLAQENRDAAKVAQTLGINARNGWRRVIRSSDGA